MLPLIYPTDKLIIEKSNNYSYEDIVVFQQNQLIKAHRVLYASHKSLITKGDNNNRADKKINQNQVLGVVHQIIRNNHKITLDHIYFTQSLKYFKIITSLVKSFDKNDIPYLFLKGLPIHLHYHQSPPRHLFLDLDILVSPEKIPPAKKILTQMGFKSPNQSPYLTKNEPTQYSFYKIDQPTTIVIDLHIEPGFGFTKSTHINNLLPDQEKLTSYLFCHTQKISLNHQKIRILSKEAQIILLLLHFYHHNFKQIQKLAIIQTINHQKINWNQVFSDIHQLKLTPFIEPALILFDKYYQNIIPHKHFSQLQGIKNSIILLTHRHTVFNQQNQSISGIHRFILILFLSTSSPIKKIKTILNRKTLLIIYKIIKSFLTKTPKNSSTSSLA